MHTLRLEFWIRNLVLRNVGFMWTPLSIILVYYQAVTSESRKRPFVKEYQFQDEVLCSLVNSNSWKFRLIDA
ncbi:unnamed protein product [Larinioides sclopetarius]|uniref:Uncharacterized protein n=1 Tax=Larinioides sclopetarius TaxID=280406 RepID=A0AAV1Z9N9_9ARAC